MATIYSTTPGELSTTPPLTTRLHGWVASVDHKQIGIMYLIMSLFFMILGGLEAFLIRAQLWSPNNDLVGPETFNQLFTMHGTTMIFFVLMPMLSGFANYLVPLMIGARDVAFPKLNLLSWYCYMAGGACATLAILMGGIDTGWTFYTPYSSTYSNSYVTLALVGVFINGFSSILTGVNFMTTVHKMRAPGMTWFRLPLFI